MFKINWTEVRKLGESADKASKDLNTSRLKFQEIVNSLPECWEGIDSEAYIKRCNEFLDYLNNDVVYFDSLSHYFGMTSNRFNKVVSSHTKKLEKIKNELEEDKIDINQDVIDTVDEGDFYV